MVSDANNEYDKLEESVTAIGGEQQMRNTERMVILPIIDQKWREHLYEMDYLKEGIGLRAMAQRDPLIEYQREGFDMFNAMLDSLKEESVGFLYNLQVQIVPADAQDEQNGAAPAVADGSARVTANEPPGCQLDNTPPGPVPSWVMCAQPSVVLSSGMAPPMHLVRSGAPPDPAQTATYRP